LKVSPHSTDQTTDRDEEHNQDYNYLTKIIAIQSIIFQKKRQVHQ
jgi:hypothetical protein